MIIKSYTTFLESLEDGYSEEFDKKWSESETKVKEILSKTDKYEQEELILLNDQELDDILKNLSV
jgi:vacuolar-type H+-ATPase catalytic subunit A/Vma1